MTLPTPPPDPDQASPSRQTPSDATPSEIQAGDPDVAAVSRQTPRDPNAPIYDPDTGRTITPGLDPEEQIANQKLRRQVNRLYPWLPEELVHWYVYWWTETGDTTRAWEEMLARPELERYFPGIKRPDGTLRMELEDYAVTEEGYDNVLASVGINPAVFRDQYWRWIKGEVSPDELFAERVEPMYERILEAAPEIKAWYATQNGLELTTEAILASALDPEGVGSKVLEQQITMAEIGGTAVGAGFEDIDLDLVERLRQRDYTRVEAEQLFGQARSFVPVLDILARRHADPDDTFDLEEFTSSEVFNDPIQRRRMRRLMQQERASFTGGAAGTFATQRTGEVTGLRAR